MISTHIESILWEEKYRPKTLQELILPQRVMKKIENGVYTHFLFYGSPGSGKTSTAKVLAQGHPYMYINCSDESGVDNVRTKITDFASTLSLVDGDKKTKIIILDEFDGVSEAYFKALRGTIEKFHKTTRFIATCNFFNKIPDYMQSRFECINFDFDNDEVKDIEKQYMRRVYMICKNENLDIEKDAMVEIVRRKFPDLRNTIKLLQGYSAEGTNKITLDIVKKFNSVHRDVFELIMSDSTSKDMYSSLGAYSNSVDEVVKSLGTDFLEYIQEEKPENNSKIGAIAYEVNQHSNQLSFVIDPYVCLLSLVFKLQQIIKK